MRKGEKEKGEAGGEGGRGKNANKQKTQLRDIIGKRYRNEEEQKQIASSLYDVKNTNTKWFKTFFSYSPLRQSTFWPHKRAKS